jgi:pyocin large subunit-like protein
MLAAGTPLQVAASMAAAVDSTEAAVVDSTAVAAAVAGNSWTVSTKARLLRQAGFFVDGGKRGTEETRD